MILDQLIAYVQFGDGDRARLRQLHGRLAPHFPAIAERFYEAVSADPQAAAMLKGPDQTERLRVTLIDWMASGLLGPHDAAFNEKRSRIGRKHVQIGLQQQYMFTAMNVVRVAYLDRISELYPADEALQVMRSVEKLFDLELALMLRHYQLVSEERLVSRERAMLADRLSALQTMCAGLAHEVRNPLNAAKLQLDVLERRLRKQIDDAKLIEPVDRARHEIARLTTLLGDFLAFAQPADLHVTDADVVAIAQHVIELEKPLADQKGATVELDARWGPAIAGVDAEKLHHVLQHLVRNAIEAVASAGRVVLAVAPESDGVRVRVIDNGRGIPDHVVHRIYEPFFTTKDEGTGMGMAIVHNFVRLHGGRIDVATGTSGTTVEVFVPHR